MGKADTKGRGKEQYVPLPYNFLKSEAWRSLSGAAVRVFLELHTRFNGGNNGRIHLSVTEAVDALGIGRSTVKRAFDELQEKGFLVCTSEGSWYHRKAHEWRLTTKPVETRYKRSPATNEWRAWRKPGKPSKKQKSVPKRNGEHVSSYRSRTDAIALVPNQNPSGTPRTPAFGPETEH